MGRMVAKYFYPVLFIDWLRWYICRWRWILLRRKLRIFPTLEKTGAIGPDTISHNLGAFEFDAVFGMAKRMSLLLFPVAALLKDRLPTARILIVGPRTEDDIFWAWSLGLRRTEGIDLFSYSKYIALGDIHDSGIAPQSYDAVLLGWMISYSTQPEQIVSECKRILKPGGYLGIGIESNPAFQAPMPGSPRVNVLNSTRDLIDLVKAPVVFTNEPYESVLYDCAVIFKNLRP